MQTTPKITAKELQYIYQGLKTNETNSKTTANCCKQAQSNCKTITHNRKTTAIEWKITADNCKKLQDSWSGSYTLVPLASRGRRIRMRLAARTPPPPNLVAWRSWRLVYICIHILHPRIPIFFVGMGLMSWLVFNRY